MQLLEEKGTIGTKQTEEGNPESREKYSGLQGQLEVCIWWRITLTS